MALLNFHNKYQPLLLCILCVPRGEKCVTDFVKVLYKQHPVPLDTRWRLTFAEESPGSVGCYVGGVVLRTRRIQHHLNP